MATDPGSGTSSPVPFAYFDRDSCSWRMCQASLLEVSGEFCTTWPRQGTWDRGFVWELPTSEHLTDESESSSLLPTPSAYESTPTDDYTSEVREHLADTHKRLYLPGRKWHAQRTLSRMAGALLPTPGAGDSHGGEGPTRLARQEEGDTGGPALRDIGHLLPTPTTQDAANTAGPSQQERNTPPLNAVVTELLPTPVANPDNPGAGGELRAALEHGPGRRNETGIDSMGRPNRGRPSRLLPTPTAEDGERGQNADAARKGPSLRGAVNDRLLPTPTGQDARQNALNEAEAQRNPATMWATMGRVQSGDHTSPRFGGGSTSSDEQHPGQLTLEDA